MLEYGDTRTLDLATWSADERRTQVTGERGGEHGAVRACPSTVVAEQVDRADFSDEESQHVLAAAARTVARELGRQAARTWWATRTT